MLAGPETESPPRSQGCGPVIRSGGSLGWLPAFRAGDVSGVRS